MAAPRPRPVELKLLAGNPGKRKLAGNNPKIGDSTPKLPEWLSAEAKEAWNFIVPEMAAMRVLGHCDSQTLANYCETWARWKELTLDVCANGMTQESKYGTRARPEAAMLIKLTGVLKAMQVELGLCASGRTRIQVDIPKDEKSTKVDLLRGPKVG